MTIDVSKVRVGDFLTWRGKVDEIDLADKTQPFLVADSWPEIDIITLHEPRTIEAGDKVELRGAIGEITQYLVLAVSNRRLWLENHYGRAFTGYADEYEVSDV